MSRKLEHKNTINFDVIREYVAGDSKGIILNETQQGQLNRWNYYINLKLQGELGTNEIIKKMMAEFDVQRATCFNDMGYAEALFGYSSSMNKRFRIGARIDFLEEKISNLWKEWFIDSDGEKNFYKSDTLQARNELAAKLETSLQRYYSDYPDLKQNNSPRIINYNFTKNEYNVNELPEVEEAIMILENAAKEQE